MNKIKTIIRKEWAEVFKNRMVLFTVVFLPLVFTALPLAILYGMRGSEIGGATSGMPAQFQSACPATLNQGDCLVVYMLSQFMIMFMMMPLIIPATIAAYSIVGEKTTRSLEPLLATPITTLELLVGKSLAAAIPAILATFGAFALYAVGVFIMVSTNPTLIRALLDARWLIAIFVVGPLMAMMSISVSIMVSSRVNDPRAAEQISMIVILPVLGLFFAQVSGLFMLNRQAILIIAAAFALADVGLVYLATRFFQRENILTRWK